MDRNLTSPVVLLIGAVSFLIWSIVLLLTPGGSRPIEWLQFVVSVVTTAYALFAVRKNDPVHNRRCCYLVLAFGVLGIVIVLGLASDQRSSRTWARLGWAGAAYGYLGSVVLWIQGARQRLGVISFALFGAVLMVAAVGITLNCDPTVQRTWCDPTYEKEQILAETIAVDGELERVGRSGASIGAAFVAHFLPDNATIEEVTHLPGEWVYEARTTQGIERERGIFTSGDPEYQDCRLNAKIEAVPAGNRQTIYVTCGVET
ncbi:MAG: hypothetical protein WDZ96_05400 [Acidimicrobiia bacterium]